MDFNPKTREEKLIGEIYPFFYDFAENNSGDDHALLISRHLLAMAENAIHDQHIAPFLIIWARDYPEEDSLESHELLWALENYEISMTATTEKALRDWIDATSTRAKLHVINGGLSRKPDRPYTPSEYIV